MKKYLFIFLLSCSFAFAQTGTTISGSFQSGDSLRKYTLYIPNTYTVANTSVPLIINIHGANGTSASQTTTEDFRPIADTANFIVVHPQGLYIKLSPSPFSPSGYGWNVLDNLNAWKTDRNFILNLIDTIMTHYDIDSSRVYVTGYSEGGFMCYALASFVKGRFAAVAPNCGSLIPSMFSTTKSISHQNAIPVMEIHGTNDNVITYTGSSLLVTTTHVDTMVNYWVGYNNCNPVPSSVTKLADIADSATVDGSTALHYVYSGGRNGATVEFYKILNGGHTVPSKTASGTGTNQDFTAAEEIWRFFRQYNLDSLGVENTYGTSNYSTLPTGIDEIQTENNNVSIYPNPSNGAFALVVEDFDGVLVKIYNLVGDLVYEEKVTGQLTSINLKDASGGIYFYQITKNNEPVANGKIVVKK